MPDAQVEDAIHPLLAMADGLELQLLLNPQIGLSGRFRADFDPDPT